MHIQPFLTPLLYGYQAYKSTQYELTLTYDSEEVRKGTPLYDYALKRLPGHTLKNAMQPFFNKIGLRSDLIIAETVNLGFCGALGTNYFTGGDAVILVSPGLETQDKDACHWLVKHEASHIKNNDCFNMKFVPAVCAAVSAIFTSLAVSLIASVWITAAVGLVALSAYSQYREGKADDLAIAESSVEELKAGRRFFIACKASNMERKKTFFESLVITSTGENRADILHPSLASRVKKIETALHQQRVTLDEREEQKKIVQLKTFIGLTYAEMEKTYEKIGFMRSFISQFQ